MHHDDVADLAGVDPRLQIRGAQTRQSRIRNARHARRFDGGDNLIRFVERHRHRLAEQDVFAGLRRRDRELG